MQTHTVYKNKGAALRNEGEAANLIAIEPQAFTVEEVAGQIKYHPESVRRAIRQGRILALPFGTGWRIPAAELHRILTTGLPYRSGAKVGAR